MNSIKKTIAAAVFTALSVSSVLADEGMWTLYNLPDAVYEQMKAEGFRLSKSDVYDSPKALKNCVVNFSDYCTGEIISPDGLLITNHHCGFEAIRSLSSPSDDLLKNGFVAQTAADEKPCPDLFVAFMRSQKDITERMNALGIRSMKSNAQEELIDSVTAAMTAEVKKVCQDDYVEVKPFYEGNAYYATTYRRYTDIRLVAAPPKSMGKFGGETDNWMWPRQTCDFAAFRVYAKDGGTPADYAADNTPLKCEAWLPVTTKGYREGDFAMTIGYPGTTSRYVSSYGIKERRDCVNEPTYLTRDIKLKVMKRHMDASTAVRIKYDSRFASCANYWKNSIGMNKCIDSIGLIQQKCNYETVIAEKRRFNFTALADLYARRYTARRASTFFNETFKGRSDSQLANRARRYAAAAAAYAFGENKDKRTLKFDDESAEWDKSLDIDLLAATMQYYRTTVPTEYIPDFYRTVDSEFGGDCQRYVEAIWRNSQLVKDGKKLSLKQTKRLRRDIGVQFAMSVLAVDTVLRNVIKATSDSIRVLERNLCAAKLALEENLPHYSDANFTMRLSYGQVAGYNLAGRPSGYYTTAPSIVAKMNRADENEEYRAEKVMRTLLSADAFDDYTDSVSQSLNLCFLTNNDITGGNSGSPVIDGYGRLIGLAFDGTWDSLSNNILYDKTLTRTIAVDIRYVLYLLRHWGKADRIVQEMTGHEMAK